MEGKGFYSVNECGAQDEYLCGLCAPPQYTMPEVPAPKEVLLEATENLGKALQSIGLNTTDAQEQERMKDELRRL